MDLEEIGHGAFLDNIAGFFQGEVTTSGKVTVRIVEYRLRYDRAPTDCKSEALLLVPACPGISLNACIYFNK
jgi:hypothetical protein